MTAEEILDKYPDKTLDELPEHEREIVMKWLYRTGAELLDRILARAAGKKEVTGGSSSDSP